MSPKKFQELSFRQVLDLVQEGVPEAREELFVRLSSETSQGVLLLSMARRLIPRQDRLRDLMETRDLVQSALRSGWLSLSEFQGSTPGEFLNWIRTILRRKFIRAVRKMRNRPDTRTVNPEESSILERSAELPLGNLIREEICNRVHQAIENLPEGQRLVIQLRIEGLRGPQIAAKLGLNPATVRKRESRALTQLRGLLDCYGPENP